MEFPSSKQMAPGPHSLAAKGQVGGGGSAPSYISQNASATWSESTPTIIVRPLNQAVPLQLQRSPPQLSSWSMASRLAGSRISLQATAWRAATSPRVIPPPDLPPQKHG